jgi:hypothetical protein
MTTASTKQQSVSIFLILLVCYAYFLPKWGRNDWAASSRAALVYAVGDQGVLYIDEFHDLTGDKAYYNGHYYAVGSIGPSLVALPFYWLFKVTLLLPGLSNLFEGTGGISHLNARYTRLALTFITFFAVCVPSAALGCVFYVFASRFTSNNRSAYILALTYGLATIAFPYSKALFQHQLAAFGAFVGFFLLWKVCYEHASPNWLWLVGVLFGFVAITEYPVALFVGFIFLWSMYESPAPLAMYRVVLGALPMLFLFAAYNFSVFGTPLPVAYRYHVEYHSVHAQGFMGLTGPSLSRLYGITISPFRGLFYISPILLLVFPGLYYMYQDVRKRAAAVLLTVVIFGFFFYNASYLYWNGGNTVGPRFLVPMLPFMTLPIIFVFNKWATLLAGRAVIGVLCLVSFVSVWVQTVAGNRYPPVVTGDVPISNPLVQYSLPLLLSGNIADNYATLVGVRGFASLVPLVIAVIGIYLVVAQSGSVYRSVIMKSTRSD